jgi:copper chaperone CopZ
VIRVETDVHRHTAKVVYDHTRVTVQELVDALRDDGITVQSYESPKSKYQTIKQGSA